MANIYTHLHLSCYEPISPRDSGAINYGIEVYDRVHDSRVVLKRTYKLGTKLSKEYEILSELKDCEYVIKLIDTFYSVNDEGKLIQNLVFEYDHFLWKYSWRDIEKKINLSL